MALQVHKGPMLLHSHQMMEIQSSQLEVQESSHKLRVDGTRQPPYILKNIKGYRNANNNNNINS